MLVMLLLWPAMTSNAQVNLTPQNGWRAFELLTQGDDIGALADSGYGNIARRGKYDGLGAHVTDNTLSVWLNHETSGAAISRVELDIGSFRQGIQSTINNGQTGFPSTIKTGIGYAYDAIFDGTYHAQNNSHPVAAGTVAVGEYGDANFDRFCSGTSYSAHSFGVNRGFVDDLYLTGEEVDDGRFYALGQNTRQLWEIPDFLAAPWENGALIDTGNTTHVALLLNADTSSSPGQPLRMYVGKKGVDVNNDGQIDLLERNGLRGGSISYFDPDPGFSKTDLPDGLVSGTWTSNIGDALTETKLEDIHTNPMDSTEVVFADQTDGVYRMSLDLVFDEDGLDLAQSKTSIFQIDDDDSGLIGAPDNVTWALDGLIYVQEDGDGDGMFLMNPDGTGVLQIATAFSEPSGIIDISSLAGYEPGGVFLTSVMGTGESGAQLITLISPNATRSVPEPGVALLLVVGTAVVKLRFRRRRIPLTP